MDVHRHRFAPRPLIRMAMSRVDGLVTSGGVSKEPLNWRPGFTAEPAPETPHDRAELESARRYVTVRSSGSGLVGERSGMGFHPVLATVEAWHSGPWECVEPALDPRVVESKARSSSDVARIDPMCRTTKPAASAANPCSHAFRPQARSLAGSC